LGGQKEASGFGLVKENKALHWRPQCGQAGWTNQILFKQLPMVCQSAQTAEVMAHQHWCYEGTLTLKKLIIWFSDASHDLTFHISFPYCPFPLYYSYSVQNKEEQNNSVILSF